MLAGAADEENDWLFRLVGALMGFCAALFFAMFAVGFVALWSLWSQLVWQLKRARIGPLLVSSPLAIVWLGLGLGVFLMFGILLEKIEKLAPFFAIPIIEAVACFDMALAFQDVRQPMRGQKLCGSHVTADSDGFIFCNHDCCCCVRLLVDNWPNHTFIGAFSFRNRRFESRFSTLAGCVSQR